MMSAKKKMRFDTDTVMLVLIVALIVIFVINIFVVSNLSGKL